MYSFVISLVYFWSEKLRGTKTIFIGFCQSELVLSIKNLSQNPMGMVGILSRPCKWAIGSSPNITIGICPDFAVLISKYVISNKPIM